MTLEQILTIVSPLDLTSRHVAHVTQGPWLHDQWEVTLTYDGRSFTTDYRTGLGHRVNGEPVPPRLADVLECLLSDATDGTFDEWCSDLGYDNDSRKALATFHQCRRTRRDLIALFGRKAFNDLSRCES